MLDMGPRKAYWNSNLNFQPVLPVALTKDWNLITRPVMTVFNSVPYPDTFGQKRNIQLTVAPVLPKLIKGELF